MKTAFFCTALLCFVTLSGCAQNTSQKQNLPSASNQKVGGHCEGCEAIYESPDPFDKLSPVDTLPDFNDPGVKIEISGIVYKSDGRTPAKDVVIYVYHTDQTGHYTPKGKATKWGKQHGYIRGWMKTDKNGFYQFYTLRPAPYPEGNTPQHIHVTIKETDKNEYWIDSYLFDDDPHLTKEKREKLSNRGGDGIIQLKPEKDKPQFHGTRHIILGANVPDYPMIILDKNLKSGLAIGANCPAFEPLHLSGADKDKKTCPMCKYAYGQGVMVWFNHANLDQIKLFANLFEKEMEQRGEKNLRVFLVYMNPFYKQSAATEQRILHAKIEKWCREQNLNKVAMFWVPSPVDAETCGLYQINPEAKNTVFVYKKRKVISKWVNIDYNEKSAEEILAQL